MEEKDLFSESKILTENYDITILYTKNPCKTIAPG